MRITTLFLLGLMISCGKSNDDGNKGDEDLNLNAPESVVFNAKDLTVYKDCEKAPSEQVAKTIDALMEHLNADSCEGMAEKAGEATVIWLDERGLTDLSSVSGLPNLISLYAQGNEIEDISFVRDLDLELLDVSNNRVMDINPIVAMADSLSTLKLAGNAVADFTPVLSLEALKWLEVDGSNLDVAAVAALDLEALYITGDGAQNLSSVKGITSLYRLKVAGANLENADFLSEASLAQLTYLSLANNKLSDLSGFPQLKKLDELDLSSNEVVDLSFVDNIPQVVKLDLSGNLIEDITPLLSLSSLDSVNFRLVLDGNEVIACPSEDQSKVLAEKCD
ncbi:leucine-rich repeat domain-containing protein [Pseudobacteriovorax antillogorgiicola]|uniref:Leucine Rich repeat-containing protein n=1 Tax=Pseudobacteriovorax antillogorgiicola TaxID=1513793 RepID=A0A1Y6BMF5_9BACT|nr:leucine-rich repeat domain-containing protein [Pseudobacteriovorax antillogorgiicola]TCS55530.1 leucine rich repeat (LRR) protein [Pseudobacteriovorax antillogorgiicola]SMF11296.1 Leucine Rich repeat-containing protein [Pseudobacteriovorax antillogorgiicola]